jgi:hypothetical protein
MKPKSLLRIHPARNVIAVVLAAGVATGQVPDAPAPAPAPAPTASPAPGPGAPPAAAAPAPQSPAPASKAPGATPSSSFLGRDVPSFDPGTDVLTWDGKNWNINNNRLFGARFEKYLNAPEATTAEDRQYQAIIAEILVRLAQSNATKENVDYAFRLLTRGSNYDIDARLCDSLADAVYTVWIAQRQQQRLVAANQSLQYEAKEMATRAEWQAKAVKAGEDAGGTHSKTTSPSRNSGGGGGGGGTPSAPAAGAEAKTAAIEAGEWKSRRLVEIIARQKANEIKRELSEIQAKVEYQALIVQFFLQRRFQHVLMATRFYRAIFPDGDSKLNVSEDMKQIFTKSTGFSPTVSTLDSLANEAIRDVREGIKAFEYLLEKDELQSASKRLAEAFAPGEYMPEIRTLPREKKRRCVEFVQRSNELLAKMEMKDYGGAEKVLEVLGKIAKDFDPTRARTGIETEKTVSRLHLAKARNAALSGDKVTLEKELAAATERWPLNPDLSEMAQKIFAQGDVQQQALLELDQLIQQKNYRRIYDNSARYIAAASQYPDREKQLKAVLDDMKKIETAVMRAEEMRRQNNFPGAWESVESVTKTFPDDTKLNQLRADLTTMASDFVRTLRSAEDLEKRKDVGASLSHYLKAQRIYPGSEFAAQGIDRLKKEIFPEP